MNRRSFIAASGAAVISANAVLGRSRGKGTDEDAFAPLKTLLKSKEPLIWIFTGDSITHGALHTFGQRSYVEHFAERVRWELRRMNDVVINTGISGDTMKGISAGEDRRIFQFRPNVVSLNIGMNDCRNGSEGLGFFRDSIEALIKKSREAKALLILNTPNIIYFPNDKARADLPLYVDAIRELAGKHKIALVDHYAYWQKEAAPSKLQMWLNDGSIHPNRFGHLVLARKIFLDLGIFDANSMVCKLFVP
jgi:lysophospholipase L1-like esterase